MYTYVYNKYLTDCGQSYADNSFIDFSFITASLSVLQFVYYYKNSYLLIHVFSTYKKFIQIQLYQSFSEDTFWYICNLKMIHQ